jgi:hypothetical protein
VEMAGAGAFEGEDPVALLETSDLAAAAGGSGADWPTDPARTRGGADSAAGAAAPRGADVAADSSVTSSRLGFFGSIITDRRTPAVRAISKRAVVEPPCWIASTRTWETWDVPIVAIGSRRETSTSGISTMTVKASRS